MHTYVIATDGASNTNHVKSPFRTVGWGFTAHRSDGRKLERCGSCSGPSESNQSAELEATIQALSALQPGVIVEILTDSSYVLTGATNWIHGWKRKGWKKSDGKPVLHRDRWELLDKLMSERQVRFTKVKGHSGHPMNERADALAVMGMTNAQAHQ